jgi:predicted nucleotidyltransferase component of viral defense system
MTPSRETLQRLQSRWDFAMEPLEIVVRLGELLRAVRQDAILRDRLVLKGGTALNLCYGSPQRLSVDLDFNDIGASEREQMQSDRPLVAAALERVARRAGYQVQRSREEHAGQKFFLNYQSALGGQRRVEVDVNFLYRVPLRPVEDRTLWQLAEGDEPVSCRVVSTAELVAGKILALLDRAAPRDLYDVSQFGDGRFGTLGDQERRIFIALSGTLSRALSEYGWTRLDRVTDPMVARSLHPLLRRGEQPTAAHLQQTAWQFVEPWLRLSAVEREYTARLQHGELRPELLFPDDEDLVNRLRTHPVLTWKAQNARRHAARRHAGKG